MRGYASVFFFCAVLMFVSIAAPNAAENAAGNAAGNPVEYRAPVTGAKLGPAQPVLPAQPATQGQPAPQAAAQPEYSGQPAPSALPAQSGAPSKPGAQGAPGVPAPWASGGMMPYSSIGAQPVPASPPDSTGQMPAASEPNAAAMPDAYAAPGYTPAPAPGYAPGYAPYPAAPGSGGQGGDVIYGTGQLQGDVFNDRGIVTQYRDPLTGDIVTSVIPPSPPEQQNYGTIFVAPQIYPDGNNWGGNPHGPMPRPGQPYMPPGVIWQPPYQGGGQYGGPTEHNRHRHSDRRHDDRRHDDRRHDYRHDDRYDSPPGYQGNSPYDQRDVDRNRDGRERR